MALPNIVLAGLNWSMYMEPSATPTPYSTYTSLGSKTLSGAAATPANIVSLIIPANLLKLIAIPDFSPSDDANATYTQAGQRFGERIVTQGFPPVLQVQFPFLPNDPLVGTLSADAFVGNQDRLYIFVGRGTGTDQVVFCQIGRASTTIVGADPTDVSKITVPISMRGNAYGWSFQ